MAEHRGLFDEETVKALKEIFSGFPRKVVDYLIVLGEIDPPPEGETPLPHEHEHMHEHLMHGIRDCPTCGEAVLLAKELMRVSDGKLEFRIIDKDSEEAKKLIPRYVPAFIYDTPSRNIRYYGLPSGQEFAPFIYIHKYIATNEYNMPREVLDRAKEIDAPLHVKIFVTPECPYCPLVVDAFNQFALVNDKLLVETIEAVELPLEADMYGVAYVPDIVITDPEKQTEYGVEPIERINGYLPPDQMVEVVIGAAEKYKGLKRR